MEKSKLKRSSKLANMPQHPDTPVKLLKKESNLQLLTKSQLIDKVKDLEKEISLLKNKINYQKSK